LGVGVVGFWGWGVGPHPQPPNPQSPIPNPQSPIYKLFYFIICNNIKVI